jgi:CheY-like chemotaxis protein
MISARHILVVDDDYVFTDTVAKLLRDAGHRVSTAHHFESALRILEAVPIVALLITDIIMPGSVNGIALARMARVRRPAIKVIYVTGFELDGAEREASGPILRKPISANVLFAAIEEALAVPP